MPNSGPLHTGTVYLEPLTPPDRTGSDVIRDPEEDGGCNLSSQEVWSPDVEQSFREALALYPPCGRRKVNLRHGETGRMYGRNELISRYITQRTGKTRNRKQISSHIQVMAKRRARGFLKKLEASRQAMEATPLSMPYFVPSFQHQNQTGMDLSPSFSLEHIDSLFDIQAGGGLQSHAPSSFHRRRSTVKTFDSELASFLPSTETLSFQHGITQTVTSEYLQTFGIQPGLLPLPRSGSSSSSQSSGTLSSADVESFSNPPRFSPTATPFSQPGITQIVTSGYDDPIVYFPRSGTLSSECTITQTVTSEDIGPFGDRPHGIDPVSSVAYERELIDTDKLKLVEFSAFVELSREPDDYRIHLFVHVRGTAYATPSLESVDVRQIYDKFPEKRGGLKELFDEGPRDAFFLIKVWADLDTYLQDDAGAFYGFSSQYEGTVELNVMCSIKVCSFGKEVVEKVVCDHSLFENGRFVFKTGRLRMCEYMIRFIQKLKRLPEHYMINSVLENFTILQTVTDLDSRETLLCVSYVFEVSKSGHETHHHIYRLVKN